MYDFLIETAHTLVKNGLTLSSAGAIVFLLLKQRRLKRRLRKFIPWLLQEDNEVKEYVTNQQIIMENQRRIMKEMGIESCDSLPLTSKPATIPHIKSFFFYSRKEAGQENPLRRRTMRNFLKKLERTKLQTYILATFMNLALLVGYVMDVQDIQSKVDAWMPMANLAVQTILTIVYQWVEGSIDKARAEGEAVHNETAVTTESFK